jgi:hypothetical protein
METISRSSCTRRWLLSTTAVIGYKSSQMFARLSLLIAFFTLGGCVRVKAFERGQLAAPCMMVGLGEDGASAAYRAKLVESRTAGGLPGSAPGGGCGCAQ